MTPHLAAKWIWIAFGAFWLVAAFVQKRTARRQSAKSRLLQVSILWIAFAPLFIAGRNFHLLHRHVFATPAPVQWAAVLLMVLGCGFAIWARVVLGGNWSGTVTVKENHALIIRGPYGWVRHPIYTGILLLLCGTAMMMGTLVMFIEVAAVTLALSLKIRAEESMMTETFGEQYISYRRRVKALLPFVI